MGVPARLNIGQCKEVFSLALCSRVERALFFDQLKSQVDEEFHKADSFVNMINHTKLPLEDKFDLLCDFISNYNKGQVKFMRKDWKKYSNSEKNKYMNNVKSNGIFLCFDPINAPDLETLEAVRQWCNDQGIYAAPERIVFPDGSKTLKRVIVGKQAIIRLKQDPADKYSVRGSGVINALTATPYKSNAKKEGIEPYTDTAVRIGEYEGAHIRAANQPEADACFFDLYSNSPDGRNLFSEAYSSDTIKDISLSDAVFDSRKKNREALDGLMHCKAIRLKITKKVFDKPHPVIDLEYRREHFFKERDKRDRQMEKDKEKELRAGIKFEGKK